MSDINADPDQVLTCQGIHLRSMVDPADNKPVSIVLHLDVEHAETKNQWRQAIVLSPITLIELEALAGITIDQLGIERPEMEQVDEDPDAP